MLRTALYLSEWRHAAVRAVHKLQAHSLVYDRGVLEPERLPDTLRHEIQSVAVDGVHVSQRRHHFIVQQQLHLERKVITLVYPLCFKVLTHTHTKLQPMGFGFVLFSLSAFLHGRVSVCDRF